MKSPEDILTFWFSERASKQWFRTSDAFDAEIRLEFETTALAIAADQAMDNVVHEWEKQSPEAHLALIIVLDQFSRNMYRFTAAAYAWDEYALGSAKRMIALRNDIHLSQKQRPFAYMPFMHSESKDIHIQAIKLFSQSGLEESLRFELKHKEIIDRFGRYPHRNEILNRKSTPEEIGFLKQPGSGF